MPGHLSSACAGRAPRDLWWFCSTHRRRSSKLPGAAASVLRVSHFPQLKISSLGLRSKMKGSGGIFGKGGEEEQSKSSQTPGRGARLCGAEAELWAALAEISALVLPSSGSWEWSDGERKHQTTLLHAGYCVPPYSCHE